MNDFKIDITDKYTSNTGNVEYTLYERKNGALYEMDSDLNLYNLIKGPLKIRYCGLSVMNPLKLMTMDKNSLDCIKARATLKFKATHL